MLQERKKKIKETDKEYRVRPRWNKREKYSKKDTTVRMGGIKEEEEERKKEKRERRE